MEDSFLILVGGGSGAGKTTLAEIIEDRFDGDNVLLLSTDRFYRNFENPEDANYDHPDSIDWGEMKEKLSVLLENSEAEVPKYSFREHERKGYEKVESKEVIILEGIFALLNEDVNDLASVRIYVDTDDDIRFIRRLTRDTEERGRTRQSVIDQWLDQVKPMHEEFIEPSKKNAHVIIPEDPDGNMRRTAVDLINSKLAQRLED